MADTIKTRAELIALFADNATGDISAQDLRDYLISVHLLSDLDQVVTVAKAGGQYTSIQSAIDSIIDAASDKIYTVLVYPGEYDEAITLSNYVDIVAIDPNATKILRQVSDNNAECHCYLQISIIAPSDVALRIDNANSVVKIENSNICSDLGMGGVCIRIASGIIIIKNCYVNSSAGYPIYYVSGILKIDDSIIESTLNTITGRAICVLSNASIINNTKIICTHADAESIYANSAQNVYCMNVWANRDDHANITQMITGGFNFDENVQ